MKRSELNVSESFHNPILWQNREIWANQLFLQCRHQPKWILSGSDIDYITIKGPKCKRGSMVKVGMLSTAVLGLGMDPTEAKLINRWRHWWGSCEYTVVSYLHSLFDPVWGTRVFSRVQVGEEQGVDQCRLAQARFTCEIETNIHLMKTQLLFVI